MILRCASRRLWGISLWAISFQAVFILPADGQPSFEKRSGFPMGALGQSGPVGASSGSQQAQGPPQDPSQPLKDICKLKPLTPQSWATLQLDNYLQNYSGGRNMTVAQYATAHGMPNFQCGIGNTCSAGQPCYPVAPPDWYILFAVQQWNIKMNAMKTAISFSMNFVKSTMASLFAALVPAIDSYQLDRIKLNYAVNGAMTMCSNTVFLDIFSLGYNFQDATGDVINIINNIMGAALSLAGGLLGPPNPPEGNLEAFNGWAHLEKQMATYEELLTGALANETAKVLDAGISTDQGIYGQLKNGQYVKPIESIFLPLVEDDIKNVTMAISLVKILRTLDAFVTIGQDVCNRDGPNGAYSGDNVLSYCDRQGTMFNIMRVKNKKADNNFENAWAIDTRFGYSTQLLTNASWSCQQKYGGFEAFPYKNLTLPRDVLADCIINLPVCDCRDPHIRKEMRKHGLVKACRKAGLPI